MDRAQLFKIGTLARSIKSKLRQDYVLIHDVIDFIERSIFDAGFVPAFPTCVCPDHVCSNYTIRKNDRTPLKYTVVTYDFGVLDPSTGAIVDTAITFTKDRGIKNLLRKYRSAIESVERKMDTYVRRYKRITNEAITRITSEEFEKLEELEVINQCGAHTIEPYKLHGETIYMKNHAHARVVELSEGSVFTIEPHVYVKNPNVTSRLIDSNILLDPTSYKIDTVDNRLNKNLKTGVEYKAMVLNQMCFYQQNTYTIKDHQVIRLT